MNAPLPSDHFSDPSHEGARFRQAGEMTLDLFHRDGRVDDIWLGLGADEFALLWRLAAQPGERLTGQQLLADAWHLADETQHESMAAHAARMRGKLAGAGVAYLICTDGEGRFFLEAPSPSGPSHRARG
ncbi:MAG: winged helix-turn-helix domain-containing protein [Porphyrobacter sp.]|nr:winged helix-turn-helix domain-containing protein [Porphyrobacter sp.]